MMRINLLAETVADDPQAQPVRSPAVFQGRVFGLTFAVVAAILGTAWWLLGVWQTRLDSQKAAAKVEASRVAGIAAENKRYESEVQEINRRIAAVQSLEDNRRGPVAFLVTLQEAVNRAPALNLVSVAPRDGRLSLNGAAASVTAVADLVAALEASEGYHAVMLREYHEDDDKGLGVRFKFSVDFIFQPPPALAAAAQASGAKPVTAAPASGVPASAEKHHG